MTDQEKQIEQLTRRIKLQSELIDQLHATIAKYTVEKNNQERKGR